jgi:hypothetical protein
LELGISPLPENIKAVMDYQKTPQHPKGFEDIVENPNYSVGEIASAMKEKRIEQVIHIEGPSVWSHCKGAIKLVELMDIPEDKRADLKLIMLYHDLGKTDPGLSETSESRDIARRELRKGKLYRVTKGHAEEKLSEVEAGFMVNGISGRKLEVFMSIVKNHMVKLHEINDKKLVELFDGFGGDDEEKKEAAELWAWAMQADSNSTSSIGLTEEGGLKTIKGENTAGAEFGALWQRYLDARK